MYDIIIFGGGLAGLTIAHELVKNNYKILIVEKESTLGGMVSTRIEQSGIPSEHSWRGYAPFYENVFNIMREIPYGDKTVFNNITGPIKFYQVYDDKDGMPKLSTRDRMVLAWLVGKYRSSHNRRDQYHETDVIPILKRYLSSDGYRKMVNFIAGPGYGMNKNELSMGHLIHFTSLAASRREKEWYVTDGPTHEAWIDPWVEYLKSRGVEFSTVSELMKINVDPDSTSVVSCDVMVNGETINMVAKDYICAINPFNMVGVLKRSEMNNLHKQFHLLTQNTRSTQISFRIGIDRHIEYPIDKIGFVMNDSEFNITWYPQEKFWSRDLPIRSLWSGTIIDFEKNGEIFGKNAESLTRDQLRTEILHQILRSTGLQNLIFKYNRFNLTMDDIQYFEIWHEWDLIDGKQVQKNRKWVNNLYNDRYRPEQITKYNNLYLSGAHTTTTTDVWSMEGAVESGKIVSNIILNKYRMKSINHHKHDNSLIWRPFRYVDDVLYCIGLPNVMDVLVVLVMMYIVYRIYRRYIN